MDKFLLGDAIRRAYLKHGNDAWVSVADSVISELHLTPTNTQPLAPNPCDYNSCTKWLIGACSKCKDYHKHKEDE